MSKFNRRFHQYLIAGALTTGALLGSQNAAKLRAQPPETRMDTTPQPLQRISWEELQKQIGDPTPLTLHADEMPLSEVIEKLNAQLPSEQQIEDFKVPEAVQRLRTKLSADYQAQRFWAIRRDILQKTGVYLSLVRETRESPMTWETQSSDFSLTAEPLKLGLQNVSLQSSRSLQRGAATAKEPAPVNENLSLSGSASSDPDVRWDFTASDLKITQATDQTGRSLLSPERNAGRSSFFGGFGQGNFNLSLQPAEQRGGTLKSLQGTIYGAVTVASDRWEIDNVLSAQDQEKTIAIGGGTLKLEFQGAELVGDDYRVSLTVTQSGKAMAQLRLSTGKQFWPNGDLMQNVRLLDENNQDLSPQGSSAGGNGGNEKQVRTLGMSFTTGRGLPEDRTGPPVKLVIEYGTDWRELVVPFEFKDIPLP